MIFHLRNKLSTKMNIYNKEASKHVNELANKLAYMDTSFFASFFKTTILRLAVLYRILMLCYVALLTDNIW